MESNFLSSETFELEDVLKFSGMDRDKLFRRIKIDMSLAQNSQQETYVLGRGKRPFWLGSSFYALISLLGLGWLVRLRLKWSSCSVNFFLNKTILR